MRVQLVLEIQIMKILQCGDDECKVNRGGGRNYFCKKMNKEFLWFCKVLYSFNMIVLFFNSLVEY